MSNETRSKKEFLQKILSGDFGLWSVFFPILQVTFHPDLLAGLEHDFPEDRTVYAVGPTGGRELAVNVVKKMQGRIILGKMSNG